jgi:hypothetical protein
MKLIKFPSYKTKYAREIDPGEFANTLDTSKAGKVYGKLSTPGQKPVVTVFKSNRHGYDLVRLLDGPRYKYYLVLS